MCGKIVVEMKQQGGGICVYPVCERARAIALISGHKTLTLETLRLVKVLGFEVTYKAEEPAQELHEARVADDRKVVSIAPPIAATQVQSLNPKRGLMRVFR